MISISYKNRSCNYITGSVDFSCNYVTKKLYKKSGVVFVLYNQEIEEVRMRENRYQGPFYLKGLLRLSTKEELTELFLLGVPIETIDDGESILKVMKHESRIHVLDIQPKPRHKKYNHLFTRV